MSRSGGGGNESALTCQIPADCSDTILTLHAWLARNRQNCCQRRQSDGGKHIFNTAAGHMTTRGGVDLRSRQL